MKISLNPTYFCNFRCDFCYLGELLSDKSTIDLNILDKRLYEISKYKEITHIDLYGGEIGILKHNYLHNMKQIIRKYFKNKINVITNLSSIHPFFLEDDIEISVSYDFDAREQHEKVFQNILLLDKMVSILVLASRKVIELDVDSMILQLNVNQNIKSVEIKPYSTNKWNQHLVTFEDFETFVKKWLTSSIKKKFEFINEYQIKNSLTKTYNAWSDDHIYIRPNGNFAVLDFDENDNEYFNDLNTLSDYIKWANDEKAKIQTNEFCNKCEFIGHCLSEHLREVKSIDKSCNGFKFLLEWYHERMEDKTRDISPIESKNKR